MRNFLLKLKENQKYDIYVTSKSNLPSRWYTGYCYTYNDKTKINNSLGIILRTIQTKLQKPALYITWMCVYNLCGWTNNWDSFFTHYKNLRFICYIHDSNMYTFSVFFHG